MEDYQYTEEDIHHPVYCLRCRRHTPRANFRGERGNRYCLLCWEEIESVRIKAEKQAQDLEQRIQKQEEEHQKAIYNKDTHKGVCPQCGSRNIEDKCEEVGLKGAEGFFAITVLGPLAMLKSRKEERRVCKACGNEWRI